MQDQKPGASAYFGGLSQEYDSLIRRVVPRYDEMIERLVEYLPRRASRILELGCGTGTFTLRLAERYPEAELTLVDASPEMLETVRARLDPSRAVRLREESFEEVELEPGGFDLVTSCIALHHVADKAALFRKLHAALAPGGALVYADQMGGATADHQRINWDRMIEFWTAPGHCTEEEIRGLLEHAEAHDHYAPIVAQITLLEQTGLRELDCVWRNHMWGIVTARRPS